MAYGRCTVEPFSCLAADPQSEASANELRQQLITPTGKNKDTAVNGLCATASTGLV